jgi:hypothetical protein
MALLAAAIFVATAMSGETRAHPRHGQHGNPADLDAYIAAMEESRRRADLAEEVQLLERRRQRRRRSLGRSQLR